MRHKPYPRRCFECRKLEVYRCIIENYKTKIGTQEVVVPKFSVAQCRACGALHIGVHEDNQIRNAQWQFEIGLEQYFLFNFQSTVGI